MANVAILECCRVTGNKHASSRLSAPTGWQGRSGRPARAASFGVSIRSRKPGLSSALPAPLHHRPSTQRAGIPASSGGNDHPAKLAAGLCRASPAIQLGEETGNELTFNLDHSMGAGHLEKSLVGGGTLR